MPPYERWTMSSTALDRPHPSDIHGVTDEYRTFLKTWEAAARGGKGVFRGNLNLVIQAELRQAGQDIVAYAEEILEKNALQWKAMDRLTKDLLTFLSTHDCVASGHLGEGCPDGARLIDRLTKARTVLGLDGLDIQAS